MEQIIKKWVKEEFEDVLKGYGYITPEKLEMDFEETFADENKEWLKSLLVDFAKELGYGRVVISEDEAANLEK